jgi:hypothetical protein
MNLINDWSSIYPAEPGGNGPCRHCGHSFDEEPYLIASHYMVCPRCWSIPQARRAIRKKLDIRDPNEQPKRRKVKQ